MTFPSRYALSLVLLACAQLAMAQAPSDNKSRNTTQAQVDPSDSKKDTIHLDSAVNTDTLVLSREVPTKWLQARAEDLKEILSCYIEPTSFEQMIADQEKDDKLSDPLNLIETRIDQLTDLAKNHAKAKYCE
jgi:hypothetical protein